MIRSNCTHPVLAAITVLAIVVTTLTVFCGVM